MKDDELTYDEKLMIMQKLGLEKEYAKWELRLESNVWAVLPCFRFLKPISDHLEFHRGEFAEMVKNISSRAFSKTGCPRLPL